MQYEVKQNMRNLHKSGTDFHVLPYSEDGPRKSGYTLADIQIRGIKFQLDVHVY